MDNILRVKLINLFFLVCWAVLVAKLFSWQIVNREHLLALAKSQYLKTSESKAQRGTIFASDGYPLAVSQPSFLLWASLKEIKEPPDEIAEKLAPLLADQPNEKEEEKKEQVKKEKERISKLLSRNDVVWVPIKSRLDFAKKEAIESLGIAGLGFDKQESRFYPEASIAAHLLGFVGKNDAGEDKGYFGIEGKYDIVLRGRGGSSIWERDAAGSPILPGIIRTVLPQDGVDVVTHINRSLQFLVEKRLAEGIEKYKASSGTIIIMRPQDGAILAMASTPSYDPANFVNFNESDFINPAISTSFEPGSIFKVLVMSAAIEAGAVREGEKCDICAGPQQIAGYTIRTWDGKYHPDSTPAQIIQNSDNVGMVWIGQRLGSDRLYDYLSKFGIGEPSGIDLQGEASPKLRDKDKWGLIDLATASFGQGIAVTPIQMVRAVAAIANRGQMPTPQVVDKLVGKDWEEDIEPVLKDVISKDTANKITEMMIQAVRAGEAKWAAPKDITIAGKTGTAQIPIAGHYDPEKTIASFVGFAPAYNPAFVMLITLREPQASPWASETAAPLWFSIAKEIFPILGIQAQ